MLRRMRRSGIESQVASAAHLAPTRIVVLNHASPHVFRKSEGVGRHFGEKLRGFLDSIFRRYEADLSS